MVLAELGVKPEVQLLPEPLTFGSRIIHTQEEFDEMASQAKIVARRIVIEEERVRCLSSFGDYRYAYALRDLRQYRHENEEYIFCRIEPNRGNRRQKIIDFNKYLSTN